jgi:hypothetical protein
VDKFPAPGWGQTFGSVRGAQIALINAFNRINVITRQPGGDYEPGKSKQHTRSAYPQQ